MSTRSEEGYERTQFTNVSRTRGVCVTRAGILFRRVQQMARAPPTGSAIVRVYRDTHNIYEVCSKSNE